MATVEGVDAKTAKPPVTRATIIADANKYLHDEFQIVADKGARAAEPIAPGHLGPSFEVFSNVFPLRCNGQIPIYRYDVRVWAEFENSDKIVEFTRKGKDDHLVTNRRERSVMCYKRLLEANPDFFGGDIYVHFYDGQSILYSLVQFFEKSEQKYRDFLLSPDELPGVHGVEDFSKIVFTIKPVDENFQLTMNEMGLQNSSKEGADTPLRQFIDMVTSQYSMMDIDRHLTFEHGKTYMKKPWTEGFTEAECPLVGDGKRIIVGSKKSAQFVEGPGGRSSSCAAVILDSKKAAFHEEQNLIEKAAMATLRWQPNSGQPMDKYSLETFEPIIKYLFVYTGHTGKRREYQVTGIVADKTASQLMLDMREKETGNTYVSSVADYLQKKYNLTLQFPNAPLVICQKGAKKDYIPFELCRVVAHQRVTIPQTTGQQSQQTTRRCAIPPKERMDQIRVHREALELLQRNPYIQNTNLEIGVPMMVNARQMPYPQVQYAREVVPVDERLWKTTRGHYLIPAKIGMWAVYGIAGPRDRACTETFVRAFAERMYNDMQKKGLQVDVPCVMQAIQPCPQDQMERTVERYMTEAANAGCAFIFFITSDSITYIHHKIKYLERKLGVQTQDMKLTNALAVMEKNKFLTLENSIAKTNVKLGGLNFSLSLKNKTDMLEKGRVFLGLAVNHPPPAHTKSNAPSVVGYCANMKGDPVDFTGNFFYQKARHDEIVHSMGPIIHEMMQNLRDSKNPKPKELIVYRNGVADGSFQMILEYEVPVIRAALKRADCEDTKLTIMVVGKDHNMRFMKDGKILDQLHARGAKATEANIGMGTVIDNCIVNPAYKEFYLNSHKTLQGSALTPRYTVLVDDSNKCMDELQAMTYTLCFAHQIVNLATSLPTPLYVAGRYAERGRNLHSTYLIEERPVHDSTTTEELAILNAKLNYTSTEMLMRRINA